MKFGLRTSVVVGLVFAISLFVSAQTPAQVGDVYVGTCDGAMQNTQQNEIDVYNSTGQFVTAIHGPTQNVKAWLHQHAADRHATPMCRGAS